MKENSKHLMSRTKPTHAGSSGRDISCSTVAILNSAHPIYFDEESGDVNYRYFDFVLRRDGERPTVRTNV